MEQLTVSHCTACRTDAPRVGADEIAALLIELPDWKIVEEKAIAILVRDFPFGTYLDGITFADQIALLAEKEGHHPRIVIDYKKVTLHWWTHKIAGLHRNDFVMAAKSDAVYHRLAS